MQCVDDEREEQQGVGEPPFVADRGASENSCGRTDRDASATANNAVGLRQLTQPTAPISRSPIRDATTWAADTKPTLYSRGRLTRGPNGKRLGGPIPSRAWTRRPSQPSSSSATAIMRRFG
jgi:hypothetical protein